MQNIPLNLTNITQDSIYQFPCPDWMEMSGLQYNKTCQPYLDSYLITPEPGYQIRYDRFV